MVTYLLQGIVSLLEMNLCLVVALWLMGYETTRQRLNRRIRSDT